MFLGKGDKIAFGGDQKGITGLQDFDLGDNFFQPLQGDIRGDDAPELFGAIFSGTIHGHRIRAHYDIAAAFVIIRLAPFRLVQFFGELIPIPGKVMVIPASQIFNF